MDYTEAAGKLLQLLSGIEADEELAAAALEEAGAVHAEALIASLTAFNMALYQVKAAREATGERKTTASGALLQPMPAQTAEIELDFPLTADQLAILQSGAAPEDDFNRWHMEYEDGHVRYYRNATGYCFFDGTIEQTDDGYQVDTVTVNQDDKQYSENNLGVCAAQMKILLANTFGLDDDPYWDEMDAAADAAAN